MILAARNETTLRLHRTMKLLSFWSILLLLLLCRSAALTAEEHHREHRDLIIDVTTLPFIGGYEVCVGFESQVVAIWTYVLYLILGPFFDATIGPCIGRDGWVWADVGRLFWLNLKYSLS